jgi:hypothetical protein
VGVTPVPIPNTEVKPHRAYGTAGTVRGRVGPCQGTKPKSHCVNAQWLFAFLGDLKPAKGVLSGTGILWRRKGCGPARVRDILRRVTRSPKRAARPQRWTRKERLAPQGSSRYDEVESALGFD